MADPSSKTTPEAHGAVRAAALALNPAAAAAGDEPSVAELRRAAAAVVAYLRHRSDAAAACSMYGVAEDLAREANTAKEMLE